jgi:hypothetical protein
MLRMSVLLALVIVGLTGCQATRTQPSPVRVELDFSYKASDGEIRLRLSQ